MFYGWQISVQNGRGHQTRDQSLLEDFKRISFDIHVYLFRRKQVTELVPNISEKYLFEVHEDLGILFDDDLILGGHSIENDMKYLQIYYPYIIDTSIIYNISGSRLDKPSLQKLYAIFFGLDFIFLKK